MAAVLSCGDGAALSHASATELHGITGLEDTAIHVSVTNGSRSHDDVVVHRRRTLQSTIRDGIRVTTAIDTLFDAAASASRSMLDAMINEAAKRRLVTAKQLHRAAVAAGRRPGAAAIRRLLDEQTLLLTDSELERLFLRIVRRAGLPIPDTQARIRGFRVDFHWPGHALVVETDGAAFHATPAQQTRDRARDQALTSAGIVVIRFTHAQVRFEPARVEQVLVDVVGAMRRPRLGARAPRG
jgi:very-short-patch-repair endonuclease